jgi:hypothetical protein
VAEPFDRPDAVVTDRVDDRAGDRDLGRGGAGVLHAVAQNESGDPGIVRLEGDEGIEGLEPDLERDLAVGELDLGERVFALETGLLHPGQAGHEDALEAEAGRERRLERALEDPDELPARALEVQGEEGEGHVDALAGPVEDLPVAEIAPAAERDRARADAAEREGDLVEGRAFEGADGSGGSGPRGWRWRIGTCDRASRDLLSEDGPAEGQAGDSRP